MTTAVAGQLKRVLDGFVSHLGRLTDTVTGQPLSEDIVLTIDGDWMYVLGGGKLISGLIVP